MQNRGLAKLISRHDALIAEQKLRALRQPFVEIDEITSLISGPSINVPEPELNECLAPGRLLPALERLLRTSSSLLTSALTHLHRVVAAHDALACGTLHNTNLIALTGDKAAVRHAILSVPPSPCCANGSLYETVRLVLRIFDVGILYPLPPVTGALTRLVCLLKTALEGIDVERVQDGRSEALIWIFFVGEVAARQGS